MAEARHAALCTYCEDGTLERGTQRPLARRSNEHLQRLGRVVELSAQIEACEFRCSPSWPARNGQMWDSQERLGPGNVSITLDAYSHVDLDMPAAASQVAALVTRL